MEAKVFDPATNPDWIRLPDLIQDIHNHSGARQQCLRPSSGAKQWGVHQGSPSLELEQTGVQNPVGLAFSPGATAFHVMESLGQGRPQPVETDITTLTPLSDHVGSLRITVAVDDDASTAEDTGVAIDVAASNTDPAGNLKAASANADCVTCTAPSHGTLIENGNGIINATSAVSALFETRVAASSDDAEESAIRGVDLTSADLELVLEGTSSIQTVGLRFNDVTIPQGSIITNAYIQFQVDEITSEATTLTIAGESSDNAVAFVNNVDGNDISSRPRTTESVSWTPPAWSTVGEAGPDQQTPDIATVVQEIVDRPGWASGNSLVIIITGTGERVAESYDGVPAAAPLLHVEYTP